MKPASHATLHQLQVFETTARRSYTKAAEELSMTQPTVSTPVKKLNPNSLVSEL